jgi:hypothetical protein
MNTFQLRNRTHLAAFATGIAMCLFPAPRTVSAQTSGAARFPRTADGKPDLNGVWQAMNTANWDLKAHSPQAGPVVSLGAEFAEPGDIPYLPAALAKRNANYEHRFTDDPELKCYMPGIPRSTYMPYPFQIVQSSKYVLMAYEFASASRTIYMEKVPEAPSDYWMGHSVGHWEGDTLVVDVTSFNDQTWFDRAGDYHSDKLHVVERYTPLGAESLRYEATIEDPQVFSRPWKISMPLYKHLEPNAQITDFKCVEFVEELMYGQYRKRTTK